MTPEDRVPRVSRRIVVFGATGYTGELTARALVDRGAEPVLAARSAGRLGRLAAELGGLETRVADVAQPATVAALVERGDVLVSTVGPFVRLGGPAVEAATAAGAHYLDSTGEGAFIREVFERHGPAAERAGCALVTAFGYDWVPGNLAGALALREAGERATRVDVGYFATGEVGAGAASGGTRATMASGLLAESYAWRGSRLVTEPTARRVRSFDLGGGRRSDAFSVGTSEAFALPIVHPGLRNVNVYLGWAGPLSRGVQAMSAGASLIGRLPGVRGAIRAIVSPLAASGSTGGPDAEARAKVGSLIVAEAFDPRGTRLSAVRLTGVNPYDFTAAILAWGAQTAVAGGLEGTGALGPVDAFGLEALVRGCAEAGISRS
jgi:short subunit dehydrogenase-like uncharacterized protein